MVVIKWDVILAEQILVVFEAAEDIFLRIFPLLSRRWRGIETGRLMPDAVRTGGQRLITLDLPSLAQLTGNVPCRPR